MTRECHVRFCVEAGGEIPPAYSPDLIMGVTDMSDGKYKLYGRYNSGSDIVQMLLEEIGAPYELIRVGRDPTDIEAYRKIALTDKVPALVLPQGTAMFESAAICIHLATVHPEARLAPPPGTVEHARFLQWMVYLSANLYGCALRIYYPDRYSTVGVDAVQGIQRRATDDFWRVLSLFVPFLAPFALGRDICAVDFYLYVLAGWLPGGPAPLHAKWPALARHAALLAERPSVRKVETQRTK